MSESIAPRPKVAAAVLTFRNGKVLAVSRKNNQNDFGLPGGRCEEGESTVNAALRELKEETGLEAYPLITENIHLVYANDDGLGYVVYTYLIDNVVGKPYTTEAGKIAWVDPAVLLKGSFGSYNAQVFNAVGVSVKHIHSGPSVLSIAWHSFKRFFTHHFLLFNFTWQMILALWFAYMAASNASSAKFQVFLVLFIASFITACTNFGFHLNELSERESKWPN